MNSFFSSTRRNKNNIIYRYLPNNIRVEHNLRIIRFINIFFTRQTWPCTYTKIKFNTFDDSTLLIIFKSYDKYFKNIIILVVNKHIVTRNILYNTFYFMIYCGINWFLFYIETYYIGTMKTLIYYNHESIIKKFEFPKNKIKIHTAVKSTYTVSGTVLVVQYKLLYNKWHRLRRSACRSSVSKYSISLPALLFVRRSAVLVRRPSRLHSVCRPWIFCAHPVRFFLCWYFSKIIIWICVTI